MAIVEIRTEGHLSASKLALELRRVEGSMEEGHADRCGLLFDARGMTGYDREARALFVDFNQRRRDRLCSVAVVTNNRLWHMVISAMAFASGQQMRPFDDVETARAWLEALVAESGAVAVT